MDEPYRRAAFTHIQRQQGTQADVDFYVEEALETDGEVLELGCGTGRVYLELLRAGVDADGLDRAPTDLSVLREQALQEELDPSVWQADMRAFATTRDYEMVICPFNTVQQLLETDDQLAMFEAVSDALAPDGLFVFDVFVPNFEYICGTYGEWQTTTVPFRGEDHEYRTRAQVVDEVGQIVDVEEQVNGPLVEFTTGHRMTLLPRDEVRGLARLSPFDEWTVTGDFSDEPLTDGHTTQVWTLSEPGH